MASDLHVRMFENTEQVVGPALSLPYVVVSELLIASRPMDVHDHIYLKENESTLLEIQISSEGPEECVYNWQKDDNQFDAGPIVCLYRADIDWDGCVFSCQVTESIKGGHIILHVSSPLDQFRGSLASTYVAQPEVPEDT